MISVERTKEILKKMNLTDSEAEQVRDSFRALAELILEDMILRSGKCT